MSPKRLPRRTASGSGPATGRCTIFTPGGEAKKEKAMITRRKLAGAGAIGLLGAAAAPNVARAQTRRWRMVTSWPKRLPGPGMSAERIAERVAALSGGRLQIIVHAAGEVVPAFEVLDAVGSGVAEMGHTA